jgi:hypothetical protein
MKMKNDYTKWSELGWSARGVLNPILKQWETLLTAKQVREHHLHQFLDKHAHLFFWDKIGFATVISKLRFGADYISDFVVVYDNWSNGVRYKLVEIERPDTPPFTKEGVATARLSRAIQQILSWKNWLNDHPTEAKRLFPSSFHFTETRPVFEFEIIIGTRANTKHALENRRALSETLGIEIRSFDSLKNRATCGVRFEDFSSVGDEVHNFDLAARNQLACPFLFALTDPDWRELSKKHRPSSHFMYASGEGLLKRRENEFADKFRRSQKRKKLVR